MIVAAAAVAAIVVIAVIIAVVAGGGDDSESVPTASSSATRIPAGSDFAQVSSAELIADPLPEYDPMVALDPAVGSAAPSFTASYFDDIETTIEFGGGKGAIVLFLAHWCSHCQAEVIQLSRWFAQNGLPADVDIIAISTSVDNGAPNFPPSAWFLREDWPAPVLRDTQGSDLAAGYGLSGFPFVVVVNGDGEVVSRRSGEAPIEVWEAELDLARG